jgi:hypothetical protein
VFWEGHIKSVVFDLMQLLAAAYQFLVGRHGAMKPVGRVRGRVSMMWA